jgi:outer membrane protein OmpA-like peptidoglycan-associated protein
MMSISKMRPGPFAGPFFIAAAVTIAGAGAARAACPDLIAAFDKAVAARAMDDAIRSLGDIGDNPSPGCLTRVAEFRAKLADFLIDYAGTPDLAAADRDRALATAARTLETSSDWRGKQKLADYYFAHGDRPKAHQLYQQSVAILATPGSAATDQERRGLVNRLAATQALADDDKAEPLPPTRCRRVNCGAAVVPAPLPINFVANRTAFTPVGEQALKELVETAREVTAMTLIGHAASRGRTHKHNLDLSRRRVMAVRDRLVRSGVKARITVAWRGDREPFDVGALPDHPLSRQEIWQLNDRVEVVLARENDGSAVR